jgi:uncharacterized protein (DUF1697 family)
MPPPADRRVAFLRGINVGTAKRIAMADLRKVFEELGYEDVRTLLNSGNVVFTVPPSRVKDHGARVEKAIASRLGVTSRVTILSGAELADIITANPLAATADNPSRLLLMVLRDQASSSLLAPLLKQRWAPEALVVRGRAAYLWCANGIADGALWLAINRIVGDAGTARNITTMTKILAEVQAKNERKEGVR